VRDALRRLAADDWVLGIAAAIALAYSGVRAVTEAANVAIELAHARPLHGDLVVEVRGRSTYYGELLAALGTFAVVLVSSAWLLARARRPEPE
jgi:hypothetical protein